MRRITVVVGSMVIAGVSFLAGDMYESYTIQLSCLNDPSYTDIGGIKFACIDKNQFISRYLQHKDA